MPPLELLDDPPLEELELADELAEELALELALDVLVLPPKLLEDPPLLEEAEDEAEDDAEEPLLAELPEELCGLSG